MNEITARQIDALGERLRADASPSDDDLDLLAVYQQSIRATHSAALDTMRQVWMSTMGDERFEPTTREKQVRSIIAKLRRMTTTRLTQMQDIVGFRLVVPSIVDQERFLQNASLDDNWKCHDLRVDSEFGYRAVHLIYRKHSRSVEVQLRSQLQHLWAEVSELYDRLWPGTKQGVGPVMDLLADLAGSVTELEALERSPLAVAEEIVTRRNDLIERVSGMLALLKERFDEFLSGRL